MDWVMRKNLMWKYLTKKNVILITINYRVNVFGFLAHQLLLQQDTYQIFEGTQTKSQSLMNQNRCLIM